MSDDSYIQWTLSHSLSRKQGTFRHLPPASSSSLALSQRFTSPGLDVEGIAPNLTASLRIEGVGGTGASLLEAMGWDYTNQIPGRWNRSASTILVQFLGLYLFSIATFAAKSS